MSKYYYDKYTVAKAGGYYMGTKVYQSAMSSDTSCWSDYICNINTGAVVPNTASTWFTVTRTSNSVGYSGTGDSSLHYITRYEGSGAGGTTVKLYTYTSTGSPQYDVRGSLLQSNIIAEDGTYPVDGQSGGYWYVRKGLAFPSFKMKVDGVLKTSSDGWVKIDGVLRHIDSMWTNINGVLKKI
ncbi:hypothetical protein [Clostridium sp. CF012]|uniref:hypothetical protein n=1 Tax=Clostridium sp. CF012 TaxID=2843319 RepID=UPI001C0D1E9B|nr:hypothetical protein [Clostridium sp. CF012]MBU3145856.1 hypothetical protein [Clostridium sp. CF012]